MSPALYATLAGGAVLLGAAVAVMARRGAPKRTGSGNRIVYENPDGSPLAVVEQPGTPGRYTLTLDGVGGAEVRVVKEIRAVTGLGLLPAKQLADGVPSTLLSGVDHGTASEAHRRLTAAGAAARITEI
ncbi:ribosomal protein L7/L12 [Glycomyces tenuis]|uniref:ribosomal protein L7/L12 n=1 Tax=Glycomyces tenuis TaxID=58116 RepID=UPI0004108208|nr:ribosomal protein L7/L12 [Glycomyces tenuis]